jgi:hypothetical protein
LRDAGSQMAPEESQFHGRVNVKSWSRKIIEKMANGNGRADHKAKTKAAESRFDMEIYLQSIFDMFVH